MARHWKGHHLKSGSFAFTVRNGRSNQSIPRQYTTDVPSYKGFFKSNMDDPTQEFPPWRYDRFVIQDPFLVTHVRPAHQHRTRLMSYFRLEPCGASP
jgi:hypothetical protein